MYQFTTLDTKFSKSKIDKDQTEKSLYKLDKEAFKIIRSAVKDLKKTKKNVYLNIINSFLVAEISMYKRNNQNLKISLVFEEIYTIFEILEDKVSKTF